MARAPRERRDAGDSIVSADALHTQTETARLIVEAGADYVLGLKGNQGNAPKSVEGYFRGDACPRKLTSEGTGYLKVTEKAHGQVEVRETWRVDPVEGEFAGWEGLRSLVRHAKATTRPGSEPTTEVRYYLGSLADVGEIATAIRRHWMCEVGHWHLDASFSQDEDRDTDGNRFENRAMLNKLALSLTKLLQATPEYKRRRVSVARIRKAIARNPEEHFEALLSVVDRDAFEATVEGLELTDADRRRYERVLAEAEAEVFPDWD